MRATTNWYFTFDRHVHFQDQKSVPPTHIREQCLASLCNKVSTRYKMNLTPVHLGISRPKTPQLDDRHHPPTRALRPATTVRFCFEGSGERSLTCSVRFRIIPKLMEEAHAYFGPGSGPQGAKKPSVSTHRGGAHFYPLPLLDANAARDQRPTISVIFSRRQNRIHYLLRCAAVDV